MSESKQRYIGQARPRIDGPKKLSGEARYAADHHLPDMTYAYGVFSTIASGRINDIDTSAAEAMPGVIDIFHHDRFPSLHRSPDNFANGTKVDEPRLPFEDDRIYYAGQFVAMVVAESFEQARAAAYEVQVSYRPDTPITRLDEALEQHKPTPDEGSRHERGNPDSAWKKAPRRIEAVYNTAMETHNPMEMHASTAAWDGQSGRLVLYESTQGVVFTRNTIARMFGLLQDKVEVKAPFIGSGFGGKLFVWPHAVAACAATRSLGRPVQLMVPRAQMFTTTGHRPATRQTLKLATDNDGRLQAVIHDSVNSTSMLADVPELCGRCTKSLYACDNLRVSHATVPMNCGTPTAMRAPGAAPGLFALESAMDEMAEAVDMDPVAFRLRNYTERDGSQDLPFSSIHLKQALEEGARRFGWEKRTAKPGSMREGDEILGWGVAACNWEALKVDAKAQVTLQADGRVLVSCATQDIGTGTYTVIAQGAAEALGVPIESIDVELGDSRYIYGPLSGGSWVTASILPAVAQAARAAVEELKGYAIARGGPFESRKKDDLSFENGALGVKGGEMLSVAEILQARRLANAVGEASTSGELGKAYSYRSFGAHFVEVRWDPGISRLRVSRILSAIDVGKVVNPRTAANQVEGAVAMGLGMALFEHTEFDQASGLPVNNDYAEYLVPTHADFPDMEVMFLHYPDYNFTSEGARGVGEIGTTGLAGAVVNAIYHATGKRIRDIPIRLEQLMVDDLAATG